MTITPGKLKELRGLWPTFKHTVRGLLPPLTKGKTRVANILDYLSVTVPDLLDAAEERDNLSARVKELEGVVQRFVEVYDAHLTEPRPRKSDVLFDPVWDAARAAVKQAEKETI